MLRDRNDAALKLAERLVDYKGANPLVLGIPRGGVVIASVLARELGGEMDVIVARKLGAPFNPDLAIGSIDERGNMHLNLSIISAIGIDRDMIEKERQTQLEVIRLRTETYRAIYPRKSLEGRSVIITDDGIATGATMKAAIDTARAEAPERLIAALPVGPPDRICEIEALVDETACLLIPPEFQAVGQFYESFPEVRDEDVEKILREFGGEAD